MWGNDLPIVTISVCSIACSTAATPLQPPSRRDTDPTIIIGDAIGDAGVDEVIIGERDFNGVPLKRVDRGLATTVINGGPVERVDERSGDRDVCWYPAVDQTITLLTPILESPKIICDGGGFDRPTIGDVFLIIDPP